ncbi:MAG: type II secretion system F family protein [Candidatus Eremiobacteraeota bacterium]|nr:type II secretion system F family protein [Candidatus Eremiobacteraeota bacterium]
MEKKKPAYSTKMLEKPTKTVEPLKKPPWNPFERITQEDLLVFTRQLHTLLNAGVHMVKAFDTLAGQIDKEAMHRMLFRINTRIKTGFTLSKALNEYPEVFNQIYVGIIRTGEAHGDLPLVLENLEQFLEREVNIKKRIANASVYPLFALAVCLLFALFTFKYILPNFVKFFQNMQVSLPLPTRIMIFLTEIVDNPFFVVAGLVLGGFLMFALKRFSLSARGKYVIDQASLSFPYFGELAKKICIVRFTNSLCTLLEGGVELRKALELAGKASGNSVYEQSVASITSSIKEGMDLATGFGTHRNLFGGMFPSMIRVGEESGELPVVLRKLSHLYEQDVESSLGSLSVLIEPFLILFTGVIIGFIIIAVFLPLYALLQKLG